MRTLLSGTSNLDGTPTTQHTCWIRLPYLGNHSSKLAWELQKFDNRVGFYFLTTARQLQNLEDPILKDKMLGIYSLNCYTQYTGKTSQSFSKHLGDHRSAFQNHNDTDSGMCKHCMELQHDFSMDRADLIRQCTKERLMNKAEEIETIATHR